MKRNLFALLLFFAFLLPSGAIAQTAVKLTPDEKKIAEGVTAKQLSDYLYFVASDEMEGRDTPSRGLDTTAKFIGMNLSKWGFKPAGDNGTYYQKIELTREAVDPDKTKLTINGQPFKLNEDFFRLNGNASVSAPLVFGKDGWMVKAKGIDSFQGVDVKGKIVVIYGANFSQRTMTSPPAGVTRDDLKGVKGVDWADPVTHAVNAGAVGVIIIAPPSLQDRWEGIKGFFSRGNTFPTKFRDASANNAPPTIVVSKNVGDAIFAGESAARDSAAAFEIKKNAELASISKTEKLWTQNVVAIWEGGDPLLKNEMVAIGAHYDHIGISQNQSLKDRINNGADDDGSGTVSVLSIAEAISHAPKRPKRSILFVWHCGEEKGLWGSEYFNKFPTVDIKQVIAQLNIDMIGRSKKVDDTNPKNKDLSGENAIYVIGKDMM
ncbi:MAG: M28 family peptidase, partial [Pyrinomonadaceae bacterium]